MKTETQFLDAPSEVERFNKFLTLETIQGYTTSKDKKEAHHILECWNKFCGGLYFPIYAPIFQVYDRNDTYGLPQPHTSDMSNISFILHWSFVNDYMQIEFELPDPPEHGEVLTKMHVFYMNRVERGDQIDISMFVDHFYPTKYEEISYRLKFLTEREQAYRNRE